MTKNCPLNQEGVTPVPEAKSQLPTPVGQASNVTSDGFDAYEAVFRGHFEQHRAEASASYNAYRPVYRYGYDLGMDARYRQADWASVERAARPAWEARNPHTWVQFQDIIRAAWETTRATP